MCRFFRRRKKNINVKRGEANLKQADLKEISNLTDNQEFRNSFVSETDLIQHFFNAFNLWMSENINIRFAKYYVAMYRSLIEEDLRKLENKELEVFRYQQLIEKSVKDKAIKEAAFELFSHALSMSNYSKKTLEVLRVEMDSVIKLDDKYLDHIDLIKDRIQKLIERYNNDYNRYFKDMTSKRIKFMHAIEFYLQRVKSIRDN